MFTFMLMSTIRHAKEMVISTKALNFISSNVRIIALSVFLGAQMPNSFTTQIPCFLLFMEVFWGAQMPHSFTTQILPSDQQHQCHFPVLPGRTSNCGTSLQWSHRWYDRGTKSFIFLSLSEDQNFTSVVAMQGLSSWWHGVVFRLLARDRLGHWQKIPSNWISQQLLWNLSTSVDTINLLTPASILYSVRGVSTWASLVARWLYSVC